MSWTDRDDLQAQVLRLWERGDLLRESVRDSDTTPDAAPPSETPMFPRRLTLRAPDSQAIGQQFERVRKWLDSLTQIPVVRIEWREVRHRIVGQQRMPLHLWIDSVEEACAFIGKADDVNTFRMQLNVVRNRQPVLAPWVLRYPLRALALAGQWSQLLSVVAWCQTHPRPGIYLRQLDIPGVHTKFIESHRGVLSEWLDIALPSTVINLSATGHAAFAERYGFLGKPVRIRFRLLDACLPLLTGICAPDVTLDAASFSRLPLAIETVFITENEVNFLSFPDHTRAMVIFGAGYGWEALSQAQWLHQCQMYYWGDIDTHGFAILDQLRLHFPHVQSLMMDEATLLAHQTVWGQEPQPTHRELPRLTPTEKALYEGLSQHQWQASLRLEQEHIGFGWVQHALRQISH